MTIRDQVYAVLAASFPVTSSATSIEFADVVEQPTGKLGVVVRLVAWDVDAATDVRSIRDVIEQEISLRPPTDLFRFAAFASALVRIVARALEHPGSARHMPIDFIKFDALDRLTYSTEDDFARALSVKSRLGRYLPAPQPAPAASM
jgi:hypothetical protein